MTVSEPTTSAVNAGRAMKTMNANHAVNTAGAGEMMTTTATIVNTGPTTAIRDATKQSAELPESATQRYLIEHVTRFEYSQPVSLDQMVIRLQPRTDATQRLVEFSIDVNPGPARHTHCLDLHGNLRHWFWFEQSHTNLVITTRCLVDCYCSNPFDYIIVDPGVEQVPAVYAEPVRSASSHYMQRTSMDPAIDKLVKQLIAVSDGKTLSFLWQLAQHLRQTIRQIVRYHGDAWPAHQTLASGEGACRDTAVLFMEACRAAGLAARFVSGYAWDALDVTQRELHAWAEVYLPGAGWCGYDPTTGLAVSNRHIAVAASPTPSYAAPTSGTFTGPPVDTTLGYSIQMASEPTLNSLGDEKVTYRWP